MFKDFNTDLNKIDKNVKDIIQNNYKKIEDLLTQERPTYKSFVKEIEKMEDELELEFTQLSHLNSVNNSDSSQEIYAAILPIITEYSTKTSQDERIYEVYKKIKDELDLTKEQHKVLDDSILGFKLSGSDLSQDKKDRLAEISLSLSDLSNNFSQNILDATNAYELIITDPKDVEGIPESDLEAAKCDEGWKFTLQMPSYIAYMTYGANREFREKLYREYVTRAPQNAKIIDEILALKDEKAKILGFDSFSDLSLATKMAETPAEVVSFLEELADKSKAQGQKEFKELEEFAKQKLDSWDMAYFAEKLRLDRYDLDEEIYRPYFEKTSVVDGLFEFLKETFGMEFKKADIKLWDDKAVAYDILEDGDVSARIYLDLEARSSKRGGAWMHNWQSHHINADEKRVKSSAFVVCNFPPSSDTNPSLLRHSDVVTLFHEMGHAIHHLLS